MQKTILCKKSVWRAHTYNQRPREPLAVSKGQMYILIFHLMKHILSKMNL